jgi:plastocyanin
VLLLVAAFAGCGGDGDGEGGSGARQVTADAPRSARIDIASFKFAPARIEVSRGATVTWTNRDKAPHTATAEDDSFDTERLELGERGRVTLDKPGRYRYYCVYHRFMEAEVVVRQ